MLSKIARPLCFGAAVAVSAALAQAVPFDITNPGDAVTPSSANSPGGEPSPNVIDNRYDTKYLNFDKLNTGFTVTPSANGQVIHGMTITSANDAPERDPASYILSGSNDGVNFTQIATGNLSPFAARRTQQDVPFDNSAAYQQYRLIFPTVLNAGAANSMQVGEVQLLTHMDITGLGDSIRGSSTNTPAGEQPRGALDNRYDSKYLNFDKLGTGLTVVPGRGRSNPTRPGYRFQMA